MVTSVKTNIILKPKLHDPHNKSPCGTILLLHTLNIIPAEIPKLVAITNVICKMQATNGSSNKNSSNIFKKSIFFFSQNNAKLFFFYVSLKSVPLDY